MPAVAVRAADDQRFSVPCGPSADRAVQVSAGWGRRCDATVFVKHRSGWRLAVDLRLSAPLVTVSDRCRLVPCAPAVPLDRGAGRVEAGRIVMAVRPDW